MRFVWPVLLLLLLLGAAFGPAALRPSQPAARTLVILSPHWDGIKQEFRRGFEEHWKAKTGETVRVEFWDVGGTGEIRRYVRERSRQVDWAKGEGIGVDLLFGGGTFDYETYYSSEGKLAREGVKVSGGLLEAYEPSAAREGRIRGEVSGQPLRDGQHRWHAACLSGFGIVKNRLVLERAKLPDVKTWDDLARPELRGWVSCGDPTRSGSVHMAFEVILQAYGWERGWRALTLMCANVVSFNEGGASVPRDVSLGQSAAGPCIDFYAAAPVRRQGATHVEFVFPEGYSVITPDAIAILKHGPQPELARAFMDYVLGEPGQRLWYQKRGSEGGPREFDLERLPVWHELYDRGLPTFAAARPFDQGNAFPYDGKKGGARWGLLEDLLRATLIDVHEDLKAAWAAAIAHGRADELGPELGRPPLSEEEFAEVAKKLSGPRELNAQCTAWTGWARKHYREVREKAERGGR
ncbi:MAG: ABC transporter substrate-binding protein [Planctomycetota bacterium]|nr:ABC transporter substrate-binding protein [Planctomycetota bacterium]